VAGLTITNAFRHSITEQALKIRSDPPHWLLWLSSRVLGKGPTAYAGTDSRLLALYGCEKSNAGPEEVRNGNHQL
jgi:hypothetical protein